MLFSLEGLQLYLVVKLILETSVIFKASGNVAQSEGKLRKKLFTDYDPLTFPRARITDTLNISIAITLAKIQDVDLANSILTASLTFELDWINFQLQWDNMTEYSFIEQIDARATNIWIPTILLQNDLSRVYRISEHDKLEIQKDGRCKWRFKTTLRTICPFDTFSFPKDFHQCVYEFTTAYPITSTRFVKKTPSLTDSKGGNKWQGETRRVVLDDKEMYMGEQRTIYQWSVLLSQVPSIDREFTTIGNKSAVRFKISLERKSSQIASHVIFPFIISSTFILFSFIVPSTFMERLIYVTVSVFIIFYLNDTSVDVFPNGNQGNLLYTIMVGNYFITWLYLVYSLLIMLTLKKASHGLPFLFDTLIFNVFGKLVNVSSSPKRPTTNSKEQRIESIDADLYDFTMTSQPQFQNGNATNQRDDYEKIEEAQAATSRRSQMPKKGINHEILSQDLMAGKVLDRLGLLMFFLLYVSVVVFPVFFHFTF